MTERRKAMDTTSIEYKIGELVAGVAALAAKMAENQARTEAQNEARFGELSKEIESITKGLTDYRSDHDDRSAVEYRRIDARIDEVKAKGEARLSALEADFALRQAEEAKRGNGFWAKMREKAGGAIASAIALGVLGFLAWLVFEYVSTKHP